MTIGAWWHIGRVDAFRPKGPGFESRSSRHVGTLGKSFTYFNQDIASYLRKIIISGDEWWKQDEENMEMVFTHTSFLNHYKVTFMLI